LGNPVSSTIQFKLLRLEAQEPKNTNGKMQLTRDFYNRNTLQVARDLIGMRLVRNLDPGRVVGVIVEVEAYRGEEDQGCHARAGLTPRTRIMYGEPGHAYIYFTYGMHWMLNFVTEEKGFPAAVLIRAIALQEGEKFVAMRRRNRPPERWTDGPAKICQALDIDGRLNGCDLCSETAPILVENPRGKVDIELNVTTGPRVGLNNVPEPWKSIPWRFVGKNPFPAQKSKR
jgi:DNA-3-methyladenine glycosylase